VTTPVVEVAEPRPIICVVDDMHRDLTLADAARRGRFVHLGVELNLGRTPDWHGDGVPDDVEWHIEWVKLYEGLDLAHAYATTGEHDYLATWEDLVDSFCTQVDVGTDPSDISARRLQNWIYAWQRFARAPHFSGLRAGLAERLSKRIAADAEHLRRHLTAQRNHRTLELYALLIVGLSFPERNPELARSALDELGRNLLSDVWADGVHCECSTDYHCIVLRSYLGAIANARAASMELPHGFLERVSLALDFALHIQRPDGITPSFSDGDLGDFRGVLRLGADLLDRDDLRWVASGGATGAPPLVRDATFPIGGYLTSRSGWGHVPTAYGDERYMLMDAGPIGDGGHGHYDQLSVEFYGAGRPLVVDPGRYTYADSPWRHAFKGSAAHNTVTVDGLDQTPYCHGKPKLGTSQARIVRRITTDDLDAIEAEVISPLHEVVHTRHVVFPGRRYWVVHDHLQGTNVHRYQARWHLPACAYGHTTVERSTSQTTIRMPAGTLVVPASIEVEIEPGWVSPRYGVKEPAPVVVLLTTAAVADIVTVLSPGSSVVTLLDRSAGGLLQCTVEHANLFDSIEWSMITDVSWNRREM